MSMSQVHLELKSSGYAADTRDPDSDSGSGFGAVFGTIQAGMEFRTVFNDLTVLYHWLEHSKNDGTTSQDQHIIVDAIVCLMHRLISLQATNVQFQDLEIGHVVLKACWLAALLCSFHALFPLPTSAFPLRKMVMELAAIITNILSTPLVVESEAVLRALLWCAAIGALAVSGADEVASRASFIPLLHQLQTLIGVTNGAVGLSILHSFVWPEPIYGILHTTNQISVFFSFDSNLRKN